MNDSEGLEEVRRVRHEISAEVGHDPVRLVAHYMAMQEASVETFINLSGEEPPGPDRITNGQKEDAWDRQVVRDPTAGALDASARDAESSDAAD